jgi:quinol-cytochrome oxidoreductase complex cytochrome b subunit
VRRLKDKTDFEMNILEKLKPSIRKRSLLLVAGCVWTMAGGILISRALLELWSIHHYLLTEILIGIILGTIFYMVLFARISKKHITRIKLITIDNPCFFSFFDFRSYILMTIMITSGILLRKMDIINHEILYTFYLTMGVPLLVSAFRFFSGYKNNKMIE